MRIYAIIQTNQIQGLNMKRVAVYLRCSSDLQNTSHQLTAIKKYCTNQDFKIIKIYEDHAVSGKQDRRPALDQLKQDIPQGKYDGIVVFKFDRMARSTQHLLACLDLFQRYGIDFISITEGIDTSTDIGRMIYSFLGAISTFEASLIKSRVVSGIKNYRSKNNDRWGRPRVGYDVNEAVRLRQDGMSWSRLSKKLGVSVSTLRRQLPPLLKNPTESAC